LRIVEWPLTRSRRQLDTPPGAMGQQPTSLKMTEMRSGVSL
jgi:hypothetical protein